MIGVYFDFFDYEIVFFVVSSVSVDYDLSRHLPPPRDDEIPARGLGGRRPINGGDAKLRHR